jgi:hypothetical protein
MKKQRTKKHPNKLNMKQLLLILLLALAAAALIALPAYASTKDITLKNGHDYLIYCGSLSDNKVLNSNTNDVNFCLAYVSLLSYSSFKGKHLDNQDVKILAVYYVNYLVAHPELLNKNNSVIFPHIFDQ